MPSCSPCTFTQPQGISVHPHLSSQDVPDDANQLFQLFTCTDPPPWLTSGWYPSVDDGHIHVLRALSNHYTIHLTESPPTIAPHFFRTIPLLARAVHDLQLLHTLSCDSAARSGRNTTIVVTFLAQILHALFPTGTVEYKALYATCLDICLSRLPLAPLFRRSDIVDLVVAYEAPPTDPIDGQIQHEAVGEPDSLKRKASSSVDSCSCGLKRRRNGSTSSAEHTEFTSAYTYASSSHSSHSTAPPRSVPRLPSITMSEYLAGPPVYTEPDSSEDLYLHADGESDAPNAGPPTNFFFDDSTPTRIPVLCTASHDKIYGVMSSALFARRENGISTPLVGFSFNRTRPEIHIVIGWMEGYESECPQVHVRHAGPASSSILCGVFCLADPIVSMSLVIALERLVQEHLQPDQVLCKELCQSKRSEQPQGRFNWRADFARSGPAEGWTAEKLRAWIDGISAGGDDTCIPTSFPLASTRYCSHSPANKSTSPSKMPPRQPQSQASEKKTPVTKSSASKDRVSDVAERETDDTSKPRGLPPSLPNSKFAHSRDNKYMHWRHHVAQLESLLLTHSLLPPWAEHSNPMEDVFHVPFHAYKNIAGRLSSKEFLKVQALLKEDQTIASDTAETLQTLQRHLHARDQGSLPALWLAEPLDDNEAALIASIFPQVVRLHTVDGLFKGVSKFELSLEAVARRPWDDVGTLVYKATSGHLNTRLELDGVVQALPERFVQLPHNQFFNYIHSYLTSHRPYGTNSSLVLSRFYSAVRDKFSSSAQEELDTATEIFASLINHALSQVPSDLEAYRFSTLRDVVRFIKRYKLQTVTNLFSDLWDIDAESEHIMRNLSQISEEFPTKLQVALVNLLAARAHKADIDSVVDDWETCTGTSLQNARKISAARVVYQPRKGKADFIVSAYFPRIKHDRLKAISKAFNAVAFTPENDEEDEEDGDIADHTTPPLAGRVTDDNVFITQQNDAIIARLTVKQSSILLNQDAAPVSAGGVTQAIPPLQETSSSIPSDWSSKSPIRVNPDSIGFPILAVENKTSKKGLLEPVMQLRTYLQASTAQSAAAGISEFPVFGLAVRGYQGVLTCAWTEPEGLNLPSRDDFSKLNITHIIERHCLSFDLTNILGVFDYTVFLILLHTRHARALGQRLAAVEKEFLQRAGNGILYDWKMESQRGKVETLQQEWGLTVEQIQHYSRVPIGAKSPISMEVPSAGS